MPCVMSFKFVLPRQQESEQELHKMQSPFVRRASLPTDQPISFSKVSELARRLFHVSASADMSIAWNDEDGDIVVMSSELEWMECLRHASLQRTTAPLKLYLLTTASLRAYHTAISTEYNYVDGSSADFLSNVNAAGKDVSAVPCASAAAHVLDPKSPYFNTKVEVKRSLRLPCVINMDGFGIGIGENGIEVVNPTNKVRHVNQAQSFEQSWVFRNNGPHNYFGLYLTPIGSIAITMCPASLDLFVGPINAGEASWVTISLKAPKTPTNVLPCFDGKTVYDCVFRLTKPGGAFIGPLLSVSVVVEQASCSGGEEGTTRVSPLQLLIC